MMQLRGGAVAIRVLGELWAADAIDSSTAVWLIDRVFLNLDSPDDDAFHAAEVLSLNASKVIPAAGDPDQDSYYWPSSANDSWPLHISVRARVELLIAVTQVLLVREFEFWVRFSWIFPFWTLVRALEDPECDAMAAFVLVNLIDPEIRARLELEVDNELIDEVVSKSSQFRPIRWFAGLVSQVAPWAAGQPVVFVVPAGAEAADKSSSSQ